MKNRPLMALLCGLLMALTFILPAKAATLEDLDPEDAVSLIYLLVMANRQPVYTGFQEEPALLYDLRGDFGGPGLLFDHLALLDLDRDGQREMVLRYTVAEVDAGYWVFDVQDGTVYGYEVVSRGLQELKQDGSFSYSGGAMDNGFGFMSLDRGMREILPVTWVASSGGLPAWFVEGQPAVETAFLEAMQTQWEKPDALWLPWPGAFLDALFP